jgi:hypothetical protein
MVKRSNVRQGRNYMEGHYKLHKLYKYSNFHDRNILIGIEIANGRTIRDVGSEFNITGSRVRHIYVYLCRKLIPMILKCEPDEVFKMHRKQIHKYMIELLNEYKKLYCD